MNDLFGTEGLCQIIVKILDGVYNVVSTILQPQVTFTNAGRQLAHIINAKSNRQIFEKMMQYFRGKYPSIDFSLVALEN